MITAVKSPPTTISKDASDFSELRRPEATDGEGVESGLMKGAKESTLHSFRKIEKDYFISQRWSRKCA
jgi:hypothetical protein